MHEHPDDNDSHFDFEKLPIEALIEIFSYLSPEDILTQKKVSKKFLKAADAQLLWKKKFSLHFPDRVKEVLKLKEINWYKQFVETYKQVYATVPKEKRKLFSLVKEEDLQGLEDNLFDPADLFLHSNHEVNSLLIDLVQKAKKSQAILDLIYQKFGKLETKFNVFYNIYHLTPLHWAIICNQPEEIINDLILSFNINNDSIQDITPSSFIFACRGGFDNLVKFLLEKGADPDSSNARNSPPLIAATTSGHAHIVKTLLATKRVSNKTIIDALFIASSAGHLEIINELVQAGADLKMKDGLGGTPIHYAALRGQNHAVKQLLHYEVEVDAANTNGDTALHLAAIMGNLYIVDTLVQNGADTNVINKQGRTPRQRALELQHPETAKALQIYSEINEIKKNISKDKNPTQTKAFTQLQNFIKEAPTVNLREKALIAFKLIAELAENPVYIAERNKRRKMNPEDKKDSMEIEGEEVTKLPNLDNIAGHYLDNKVLLDVTITELQSMKDKNPFPFFKKESKPTKSIEELKHKKPHS